MKLVGLDTIEKIWFVNEVFVYVSLFQRKQMNNGCYFKILTHVKSTHVRFILLKNADMLSRYVSGLPR